LKDGGATQRRGLTVGALHDAVLGFRALPGGSVIGSSLIVPFADRSIPDRDARPRERPMIIANPPHDREFRAMIDAFLAAGGRRPEDLQSALRLRFPDAVVRPRDLAGERFDVWYVYRDGHWISEGET
jgi:hypothetical protein